MIEIGVFHNGASDLPVVRTASGVAINDGNLAEVHESSQRGLIGQVRQGILADKLGFNYFFMTEHHFQPEGAEFSPNPLLAETAIASRTRQIRLGKAANIVTWWHPIRIAEQAAMLDVISNGRLEFGIGRGYQPREAEVFGWPFATIQDQERNRAYYQEAYEIIMKAWTQPSFSHHGQFFTIQPVFTRWNHQQTIAYFESGKAGRKLEEVLSIGSPDPYGGANPVMQSSTVLKELQVFPQPIQRPHPQMGSRSRPSDRSNGQRSADSTDISSSSPTRGSRRTSRPSIAKRRKQDGRTDSVAEGSSTDGTRKSVAAF